MLSVSGKISIRIDTEDRTDLRKCFDIVKKDVFKMFIAIHDQVPPRYTYKQLAYYQFFIDNRPHTIVAMSILFFEK